MADRSTPPDVLTQDLLGQRLVDGGTTRTLALTITSTSSRYGPLAPGLYRFSIDGPSWVKQGASGVVAAARTGGNHHFNAGEGFCVVTGATDNYFAIIRDPGSVDGYGSIGHTNP